MTYSTKLNKTNPTTKKNHQTQEGFILVGSIVWMLLTLEMNMYRVLVQIIKSPSVSLYCWW